MEEETHDPFFDCISDKQILLEILKEIREVNANIKKLIRTSNMSRRTSDTPIQPIACSLETPRRNTLLPSMRFPEMKNCIYTN